MKSLGFEQGHSLNDYLKKYLHQRNGSRSRDAEIYAEDFFDIQKKVWGKVKHHIHCCYSVEELIKEGYGNEACL